jgi:hypothetical protein
VADNTSKPPSLGITQLPEQYSSLDLMRLHVHACYVHDELERLVRANEPHGKVAPRFWLGRTREGVLWRFGSQLAAELIERLMPICRGERAVSGLPSAPGNSALYEAILSAGNAPLGISSGPTYWLRTRPRVRSKAVELARNDAKLLRGLLDDWIPDLEYRRPIFASMADARAVAVCASVRVSELADEAGVATAPGYRRQGHAANAVAAWAAAVMAMGRIPMYSTAWDNRASQGVARSVGFELFGEEYSIQ